jgi:hypothetical protein
LWRIPALAQAGGELWTLLESIDYNPSTVTWKQQMLHRYLVNEERMTYGQPSPPKPPKTLVGVTKSRNCN